MIFQLQGQLLEYRSREANYLSTLFYYYQQKEFLITKILFNLKTLENGKTYNPHHKIYIYIEKVLIVSQLFWIWFYFLRGQTFLNASTFSCYHNLLSIGFWALFLTWRKRWSPLFELILFKIMLLLPIIKTTNNFKIFRKSCSFDLFPK